MSIKESVLDFIARINTSKHYGPQQSRGRDTRSKCIEHKDHTNSQSVLFWDTSKKGTYVKPKETV